MLAVSSHFESSRSSIGLTVLDARAIVCVFKLIYFGIEGVVRRITVEDR